jgi:hypothetical protein
MALIIQFYTYQRSYSFGVAQQKINMLAVNLISEGSKFASVIGSHIEQITKGDFSGNYDSIRDYVF